MSRPTTSRPTPWSVKRVNSLTGPEWDVQDATGQTIPHLGNIPLDLAEDLVAHANERAELREALEGLLDRTTAEGMVGE